jgi:hypothetical protein
MLFAVTGSLLSQINKRFKPCFICIRYPIEHPLYSIFSPDGNPSYPAGIYFINADRKDDLLQHRKVIGLQNLDSESAAYRAFKQLIERLNRTFKHHVKPSHRSNSVNEATALVTLFVTHYNFLRPHMSLNWRTPIELPELENITTIQGKWAKILSLAA